MPAERQSCSVDMESSETMPKESRM